jgi:hypothetical protein
MKKNYNGHQTLVNGINPGKKSHLNIKDFGIASFAIQLIIGLIIILPNIIIFRYTGWAYLKIKTEKDWFAHTYRIKTAQDFIDRLNDVKRAEEKITFFEYVGRGSEGSPALKGSGLMIGNGGIYTKLLIPKAAGSPPAVFLFEDMESLIREVFAPETTIELEACFTAFNSQSIAYAFKKILPKAHVWGFTGRTYPLPITGFHETFSGSGSEWVEVRVANVNELY